MFSLPGIGNFLPFKVSQHGSQAYTLRPGAPEEAVLSRAGLQIPQGNAVLLQEGGAWGGAGFQAQAKSLVLPMYGVSEAFLGPRRGTGGTTGDLPQCLPEADGGRPGWPLHYTELLATTGQTIMADP